MNVAVRDAPGVFSPYNLVTDIGPPVDPNSLVSTLLGGGSFVFSFVVSNAYNTQHTAAQNAATAMTFNRIGMMGGPLKNADGSPNVGGVMTIALTQITAGVPGSTVIAQGTVDLTTWVPGQFYWSDPFPTPLNIWGSIVKPTQTLGYTYTIAIIMPGSAHYSIYINRPVTVRNGQGWGTPSVNNHLCDGPVDLSFINYADLGTASLKPTFALSGHMQAEGHIGKLSGISPQIQFKSRLHTIGDLGTADMEPSVILRATSMAGGPLWKPSKLCSG